MKLKSKKHDLVSRSLDDVWNKGLDDIDRDWYIRMVPKFRRIYFRDAIRSEIINKVTYEIGD